MLRRVCCSILLLAGSLLCLSPAPAEGVSPAADGARPGDSRMDWWRDAKFGMFIHWGVYAVPAGEYHGEQVPWIGEWIMRQAKIPVGEYRGYAKQFIPNKYDPQQWAKLAKQAGMRYVVITAKHHDGFALYDSQVTDWDIADASPYGKGLLQPLATAVRAEGLKFGLYYSQAQDWTHPGGAKAGFEEGSGWDEAHQGDYDQYLHKIAIPQTKEILTRFQPDVLWWDTPVWMTKQRAEPLHALLGATPNIITNNRLGGGFQGDTETPEQHIPATGFQGRDWETCMTMNDTWGYKSFDHNWKSTATLLHNLVDIVSKGGNYLLNVGPTAEGEIPAESIERLKEIGEWMQVNGDSIYGTTASPCRRPEWGRLTRKGDRLFLHVFNWPADGMLRVPLQVTTTSCRLLADPGVSFSVTRNEEGLAVELTGKAPDAICSVVELGIEGEPEEVFQWVKPGAGGVLVLSPSDATPTGHVQVESISGEPSFGYWTEPGDTVVWRVATPTGGRFRVSTHAAGPQPTQVRLSAGEGRLTAKVPATSGYQDFQPLALGEIELPAGQVELEIRPIAEDWSPINLRTLTLTPVE
ncbi:Alpha-L-fucosidase [Posidoniimonas polymericola]|uniref:alpha-L-fucosidase n=1 Tax=Posidoniimonas polymericola TaxID=2528002 RepID=A0A5C5YUF3_9BACT|nr:alpha-L-fucosidase [Posidoniimonas polymericola]TWT78460.1 Alpha-L-fucosidase [Posidoniimonas polymericola]